MFDTITLRINNSHRYENLVSILYDPNSGLKQFETVYDIHELAKKQTEFRVQSTEYLDTGRRVDKAYRRKLYQDSSNYEFNYHHDKLRKFLEFEFSIPKFLYGTNVFQAVYHHANLPYSPHSGEFNKYKWCTDTGDALKVGGNMDFAGHYLHDFIFNKFLGYLFPSISIDSDDIEVARLDICFNQVFDSHADAMQYLEYQRQVKKKYARDSSNIVRDWRTAIGYVGSLFYFKIYHKGEEFRKKGDAKHLKKINQLLNPKLGYDKFDIPLIQSFADRVLRYELTCHSKFLSYLHMNYIFRKDSITHLQKKVRYNKIRSVKNSMVGGATVFKPMPRGDKEFYESFTWVLTKRYRFHLTVDKATKKHHESDMYDAPTSIAPFSQDLVYLCMNKLKELFDEFQIQDRPPVGTVLAKLKKYNETVKRFRLAHSPKKVKPEFDANPNLRENWMNNNIRLMKQGKEPLVYKDFYPEPIRLDITKSKKAPRLLQESVLRSFVMHLYQYGSYEELCNSKIYSRHTLRNILIRLNKIGFDPKNLGEVGHMKVCHDFKGYHDFLLFNKNGLSKFFNYHS
jgi:hypothetical protein